MKKIVILFTVIVAATGIKAQQITPPPKGMTRAEAPKTLTVSKESTMIGFEKVIAPGRLSLSKGFHQETEGGVTITYTLTHSADDSYNNRKPVLIGLSKKSYDSVFTHGSAEMNARYTLLNKFIAARSLSLSEEKGWIDLITYYNNL